MMLPIALDVEAIVFTLLRWSSSGGGGHRWTARRHGDGQAVLVELHDGPLAVFRLSLTAHAGEEADPQGSAVWVTGQFAAKPSRLNGVLESWRARRQAVALRDEVLCALREGAASPDSPREMVVRSSERMPVVAPARLYVGERMWRAEVLDVSEGGLCVVVAAEAAAVDGVCTLLGEAGVAEVEVLRQNGLSRSDVKIRYAVPGRGGVRVGLEAFTPDATKSLLRRAVARPADGAGRLPHST